MPCSLGVDLAGWSLASATAISADGFTIVGNGVDPDHPGALRGWIAVIPEPATGGLFGAGLVALGQLRRRRRPAR